MNIGERYSLLTTTCATKESPSSKWLHIRSEESAKASRCLPSRIDKAAPTKNTHIHLVGHNQIGGLGLYDIEALPVFRTFDAVKFSSLSLLNHCLNEVSTAAFSFKHGRVANVVAERSITAHAIRYSYGSLGLSAKAMLSESYPRR